MKLKYAFPLAALLVVPALLSADDYSYSAAKSITLDVPDAERIDVLVPAGWSVDRVQSNPSLPPSIRMHPKGKTASLQITLFPDQFGNVATRPKIDAGVKQNSLQFVRGSAERELRIQDLKSKSGVGAIAEFTDGRYAYKQPPAGQFRVVGVGLVHAGKSIASFTLMGNDFDDPAYLAAKDVLIKGIGPHQKSDVASGKTYRW